MNRRHLLKLLALAPTALAAPRMLSAQLERRSEMYPLVGPYNFALKKHYNIVYRYLNVVDIGHAELAETLLTAKTEDQAIHHIEHVIFDRVTRMFLDPRRAPRLSPHEFTVAPYSSLIAPRLNKAFDWTHILHRQIYDILSTDLPPDRKRDFIRQSWAWYNSEPARAFPARLKTHDLMEHQWFSQYWREKYPRFNGAIWAYHWLQLRLNEVMLTHDKSIRDAGIAEVTAEFRAMFENPDLLPKHMPMAHTVAPRFLAEFPNIAFCFDNLHSFHDIYNDILAHPQIPDKRAEVYKQLDVYLDPSAQLETAPMIPLPAGLSPEQHCQLNQLSHLEHMALMVMSSADEQLAFLAMSPAERAPTLDKLMPVMARTWPNFEKKHSTMGHPAPHKH